MKISRKKSLLIIIMIMVVSWIIFAVFPPVVHINGKWYSKNANEVEINGTDSKFYDMRRLRHFTQIQRLRLSNYDGKDSYHISLLDPLERIDCCLCNFKDGFPDTGSLNKLQELTFDNCSISINNKIGKNVEHISISMSDVYSLDGLKNSKITDVEFNNIKGISKKELYDVIRSLDELEDLSLSYDLIDEDIAELDLKHLIISKGTGEEKEIDLSDIKSNKIEKLTLLGVKLKDYSVLYDMENLKTIEIKKEDISEKEIQEINEHGIQIELWKPMIL